MHIHAHLIIAASVEDALLSEELKIPSIDVHHLVTENFGIEDARMLTRLACKRPVSDTNRSFVVCAGSITREAQNALLKLLEEPPHTSVFYILIPHTSVLLPTLRSRLIQTTVTSDMHTSEQAAQFVRKSLADRLAAIATLQKQKDTKGMQNLAQEICELMTHNTAQFSKATLKTLLFVESHIRVKGGSKKMLLEHLALSLPVVTD